MDKRLSKISFFDLRILAELSTHKSLRALSRSLNLEPPALSKRLKSIQDDIGLEILKTSATGYALTPDGTHITTKAKDLLLSSSDFIPTKNNLVKQQMIYTFGSRGFLNIFLCGSLLSTTQQTKSNHLIRLIDLSPDELRLTVFEGVLDLAVSLEQFNWPKNWVTTEVGNLNWSLYVRKNHPLKDKSTKEDLLKYPWSKSAYWNGRAIANSSDSIAVPKSDRIPGNEQQTALVALEVIKNSDNIAIIPDIIAHDSVKNGLIKKISCADVEMPTAKITFGVNSDKVSQKLYQAFSKTLIQKLAP